MSNANLPVITLDEVSVTYPNGVRAIENITATLPAGRICALLGMNGAGKSTLFKAMTGFIKPSAGHISIAGQDVAAALKSNRVAYVPQAEDVDWNFPVLVRDVVMMGRYGHMGFMRLPRAADKTAVADALARVDMTHLAGRAIGDLSGGQKKRVFVARALAQGADIVFLDEPFAGVDIKTEESLIALFRDMARAGRTIVIATHNLSHVPNFCDDALLINKTLVAYGPVTATLTQDRIAIAFGRTAA